MPVDALLSVMGVAGLFAFAWVITLPKRRRKKARSRRGRPRRSFEREPSLTAADIPSQALKASDPVLNTASQMGFDAKAAGLALESLGADIADFDGGPVLASGLHCDAEITYRDREDAATVRRITVQRLHGERDPDTSWIYARYVFAWCHLRQDFRHFSVSRIDALTDPETGEVVEGGIKHVAAWLRAKAGLLHDSERGPAQVAPPAHPARPADRPYDPTDAEAGAVLADGLEIPAAVRHGFTLSGPPPPWQSIIVRRLLGDRRNGWPRVSRIVAEVPYAVGLRLFYRSGLLALAEQADGPEVQQAEGWLLWRAGLLERCPRDIPTGRSSKRRPNPPIVAVVEWPRAPDDLETYDIEIAEVELAGGAPYAFAGRARRRRSERDRAWTGHRRFVLQGYDPEQPAIISLRHPDREDAVPDPAQWLAERTDRR